MRDFAGNRKRHPDIAADILLINCPAAFQLYLAQVTTTLTLAIQNEVHSIMHENAGMKSPFEVDTAWRADDPVPY